MFFSKFSTNYLAHKNRTPNIQKMHAKIMKFQLVDSHQYLMAQHLAFSFLVCIEKITHKIQKQL